MTDRLSSEATKRTARLEFIDSESEWEKETE